MTTTWKSDDKKPSNKAPNDNTISGTTLSSWSCQQKLAMIAGFAILGLLLVASACSKQSPKPALVGVSNPTSSSPTPGAAALPVTTATAVASPAPLKKTPKKRPANVTYSDANSGISFLYPRKFVLASGDKAQPQLAATSMNDVQMNFVHPGGVTVAIVALPGSSYPGTDFASAFFNVNVNRSVSEQECARFAFVDTRNADGEPVDAEKLRIGSTDMEMTSDFSASVMKQAETQYYHSYENGACYEYVLGLGTAGYGTKEGVEPVNRDEIFAKLEKILATVKINPVETEHGAEPAIATIAAGKE
jgi:hypothetical protein